MIIDCISDTHGHYPKLEGGDLLIVAGDLTANDRLQEYYDFIQWIKDTSYKKKIVVCGNHDNLIQKNPEFFKAHHADFTYLQDSGTEFLYWEDEYQNTNTLSVALKKPIRKTLKIWGSPWTKTFEGMNPHCKAFTVDTEQEIDKLLYRIPNEVDILITHEAPYSILDRIDFSEGDASAYSVGSHALLHHSRMRQPKLHIFGHIHEGYGEFEDCGTKYINASHVNECYRPVNKPIRVIL